MYFRNVCWWNLMLYTYLVKAIRKAWNPRMSTPNTKLSASPDDLRKTDEPGMEGQQQANKRRLADSINTRDRRNED